jgi:hypothetical protein
VWLCDEHHGLSSRPLAGHRRSAKKEGEWADTGVPEDDWSSSAWKKVTRCGGPFNLPTDIAFAPSGEMFMTDGYGNTRVHKSSADGKHLFSWASRAMRPGNSISHTAHGSTAAAACSSPIGKNDRVQIFDETGNS